MTKRAKPKPESHPLCHRCEYRARFKEEGHAPRCECSDDGAVYGCYQYRPVMPVVQRARNGDDRPIGGPAFIAARSEGVRVAEGRYEIRIVTENNGEFTVWAAEPTARASAMRRSLTDAYNALLAGKPDDAQAFVLRAMAVADGSLKQGEGAK